VTAPARLTGKVRGALETAAIAAMQRPLQDAEAVRWARVARRLLEDVAALEALLEQFRSAVQRWRCRGCGLEEDAAGSPGYDGRVCSRCCAATMAPAAVVQAEALELRRDLEARLADEAIGYLAAAVAAAPGGVLRVPAFDPGRLRPRVLVRRPSADGPVELSVAP
jgi:hypothetical protein